jgi:hypothetical protein
MPQKTRWLAGPPIRLVGKASRLTSFLGFHDFRETRTAWGPDKRERRKTTKDEDDYLPLSPSLLLGLKDHDSKRILELVALIGKLFGRSKDGPLEIKASPGFASEKLFRRSVKRILTKYKETIRKLEK